jgi:hypothetical protein
MSTVIDTLIYDRTQEDVDRVSTLKTKALTGGWGSLTEDEQAEWLAGMRGAYNYTDLNRVGSAVEYLASRFVNIPVELADYRAEKGVADSGIFQVPYDPATVVVSPKTDWTVEDTPTDKQVAVYLNNLAVLRAILTLPADAPAVPSTLSKMTFETANDIEYLLYCIHAKLTAIEAQIYIYIDNTAVAFMSAGDEVVSGE